MTKIEPKELLKRVKSKGKPERANVTFRLNTEIMDAFRTTCEKQDVTPTAVLEEFMESFVKSIKG